MPELSSRPSLLAYTPAGRVLAAIVAVSLASASIGVSSVAFAQAKAKPAAKAAVGAKAPTAADKKKAGEHFKKGKELFDKKDYKGAKDEFSKAEEIIPAGTAEFYIGRCAEESGDGAEAASWYDKALASGKLKPEIETETKTHLDALKSKPAKVKVTSDPPGAAILVDGKDTGMKTPADVDVAPGSHKITLQAAGKKDNEQTVEVAAFTGATVNATLEAGGPPAAAEDPFANKDTTPTPPPATTTTSTSTATVTSDTSGGGKKNMTWVYVTGVGAIIGLGVGTVFGIKALSDKKDFDDNPTRDTRDRGTRDALIADMGFGIGITLAVTSVVLYFSGPSSSESSTAEVKKPTMSFAPLVGGVGHGAPSMAGAAASFVF